MGPNTITLASVPYVRSYEPRFAMYTPSPADAATHRTTPRIPPGVIQRNFGCRTLGAM